MKKVQDDKSATRGKCIKNETRKECNTEKMQHENSAT